jgi:hypothetical protein
MEYHICDIKAIDLIGFILDDVKRHGVDTIVKFEDGEGRIYSIKEIVCLDKIIHLVAPQDNTPDPIIKEIDDIDTAK